MPRAVRIRNAGSLHCYLRSVHFQTPYSPYREIEWIAFPDTDFTTVHFLVDPVGKFMIVSIGDDTRILAYS